MKILESIIWDIPPTGDIDKIIPVYAHKVEIDMVQSIRIPLNNEYIWHYYLLKQKSEEDMYLFKAMDEHIVSHVLCLTDQEKDLLQAEEFSNALVENFEIPPLIILHFSNLDDQVKKLMNDNPWLIEKNVYLTHQRDKTLPLQQWNRITTEYLKKVVIPGS
ncbi:MAG: hypothetical protein Kow00108_14870 [Calditrichia bacterium]